MQISLPSKIIVPFSGYIPTFPPTITRVKSRHNWVRARDKKEQGRKLLYHKGTTRHTLGSWGLHAMRGWILRMLYQRGRDTNQIGESLLIWKHSPEIQDLIFCQISWKVWANMLAMSSEVQILNFLCKTVEEGIKITQRSVYAEVNTLYNVEDPPDYCALWECSGDIPCAKVRRLVLVRRHQNHWRSSMVILFCSWWQENPLPN